MICLDFAVSGLMLKKKQYTYLVAGTKNCISIKVKLDRHWQDLEVFAVCYRDNKEYPYAITNGECLIADMAVISTSGEFKLKLLGSTADGNVVMTTNVITVYINDNKFSGAEGGELEYPTSDYLAEVLAGSKQAAEQAKLSADAAGESAKQAKLSAEQVSRDVELAGEYVKQIEGDATQVGKLAQQVTELAEQVNRDAMQVASDKKTVTELTGQAVKAAGNAQTYMEQAGQIKTDTQTIADNASQAMGKVITKAQADINAQGTEIITQATAQADRAQSVADGIRDTADTLQADNEHLKAELKQANRRISVLYDLGKGITHRYETDNDTAYSKDIPSGAKVMDVKMVGGKSVVGNQLIQDVKFEQGVSLQGTAMWHPNLNADVTVDDGVATFITAKHWEGVSQYRTITQGHKYFISVTAKSDKANNVMLCPYTERSVFNTENRISTQNTEWNKYPVVLTALKTSADASIGFRAGGNTTIIGATNSCKDVQLVDLTQMFGAGNEPTLEQCREIFANESYPYNAGTLTSADVTAVQVGDKVIQLPNSISLKSAGSVYDSLEFYEQDGKYYQKHTQRVGVVDLGTLKWVANGMVDTNMQYLTRGITDRAWTKNGICDKFLVSDDYKAVNFIYLRNYEVGITIISNITSTTDFTASLQGVLLYYELATPIITVAEVDNRFDAIDCKAGDKITFVGNSDYHLPVPNEEEYLIALNEVTA